MTAIVMLFQGESFYVLYLMVFLSIPLVILFLLNLPDYFKHNKNKTLEKKIVSKVVLDNSLNNKKEAYYIKNESLIGEITSQSILNKLKQNKTLEYITINCSSRIEISSLINNNPNLIKISLTGPFWLKDGIIPQVKEFYINNDYEINNFLIEINKQSLLKNLTIISSVLVDLDIIDDLFNKLKEIRLVNGLNKIPIKLFESNTLTSINLSGNKIQNIKLTDFHKKTLINSKVWSLNLSKNDLTNIPNEILNIKTLKQLDLSYNPLANRLLKKLVKYHKEIVILNFEQMEVGDRIFHPVVKRILKILISTSLIIIPGLVFENLSLPIIFLILVFISYNIFD
ncbi:MAG: hypothetical protein JJE55_09120 [Flavobacteriaceae bacterium]|nr:hypothetical protein [Flavobacteriaceae bacterium]